MISDLEYLRTYSQFFIPIKLFSTIIIFPSAIKSMQLKESVANELRCPVCYVQFSITEQCPMMICLNQHSICQHCLDNLLTQQCPFCREPITTKVPKNRYLIAQLQSINKQKQAAKQIENLFKLKMEYRHEKTKTSVLISWFQKCPNCKAILELGLLIRGDKHVQCCKCKTQFCVICFAILQTGNLRAQSWEAVGCTGWAEVCDPKKTKERQDLFLLKKKQKQLQENN